MGSMSCETIVRIQTTWRACAPSPRSVSRFGQTLIGRATAMGDPSGEAEPRITDEAIERLRGASESP